MADARNLHKRIDSLAQTPATPKAEPAAEVRELRRKLEKLRAAEAANRIEGSRLQPAADIGTHDILYRRDIPHAQAPHAPSLPEGEVVVLEEAVPGSEVITDAGERVYLIEVPVAEGAAAERRVSDAFGLALRAASSPLAEADLDRLKEENPLAALALRARLRDRLREACRLQTVHPEELLFLDLETTGLSNTPLFLIGTMTWEEGGLFVRQYLARNYAEERGAITLFLQHAAAKRLLVTFNGKSYDEPYLRTRAAAHRVPWRFQPLHFDLLHASRRAWREIMPDCRLKTLETYICFRHRGDDIPSHLIPDAYHAFVRTGNAVQIAEILRHNLLDLVTLADLLLRLPEKAFI